MMTWVNTRLHEVGNDFLGQEVSFGVGQWVGGYGDFRLLNR